MGVFARRMLAMAGYVPTFDAGLALACTAAFVFVTCQMVYVAFVHFALPWRSPAPYLFEGLSNAAALLISPYLAGIPILRAVARLVLERITDKSGNILEQLDKYEPLFYLALFVAAHAVFKLLALYAATRSEPGRRLPGLGWAFGALLGIYASLLAAHFWRSEMVNAQKAAPSDVAPYRVGDTYAPARRLREGARYEFSLEGHEGRSVTLKWAIAAEERSTENDTIYVTVEFPGAGNVPVVREVVTMPDAWGEVRLAAADIPPGAKACSVVWTSGQESAWLLKSGLRPAVGPGRVALLAGPSFHLAQNDGPLPNLVVLLVEGLGAEHASGLGYARDTTPSMQRLAADGLVYANAFSPSPSVLSASFSILSAMNPLRHGFLDKHRGPLPKGCRLLPELLREQGYHTAAFTEGEGPDDQDLVHGTGIERGFEHFDVYFPVSTVWRRATHTGANPVVPAGSAATLGKVAKWMESHGNDKQMVFVRLRELRRPQWLRQRYGDGFVSTPSEPRPLDVYDTALLDVDKQIGAFFDRIRDIPGLENTVVVVTSPYGFDFTSGWSAGPQRKLSESCLHVPIFIYLPERPSHLLREQNGLVGLDDLGAALAGLGGIELAAGTSGADLLRGAVNRDVVSMAGIPTEFSLRTDRHRLNWQSGINPYTGERLREAEAVSLLDLDWYYRNWRQGDALLRQATVANELAGRVAAYLEREMESLKTQKAHAAL